MSIAAKPGVEPDLSDATAAAVKPCATIWHGFAVTRTRPQKVDAANLALTPIRSGWSVEFSALAPMDWEDLARALFVEEQRAATKLHNHEFHHHGDEAAGVYCAAAFTDDVLTGALLVTPTPIAARPVSPPSVIVGREWLIARLGTPLDPAERFRLLAGRPSGSMAPRGPTICFCCDVGQNEIIEAIVYGHTTVGGVGAATRAGTNCGCCLEAISNLVNAARDTPRGDLPMPPLPSSV